ncbi:hypothetical protein HanRHA438_Chr06g0255091 [Helianthus annuus]|nr:hypothetical protein HanRHA438_Chr06g0255091 [Helianthus annuus]
MMLSIIATLFSDFIVYIMCLFLLYCCYLINETFYVTIIKVSIFLVHFRLFLARITCLIIFHRTETETDLFGTIIWYQSHSGSFQCRFVRIFIGKPPETLIDEGFGVL